MDMQILHVRSQGLYIPAWLASIPADYIWRRPTHATPIASFMLAHAEAARLRACEGNGRSVRSTPPSRWLTWVLPAAAARLLERRADRDRCRRPYARYASFAFAPDRPETRSADRCASPARPD